MSLTEREKEIALACIDSACGLDGMRPTSILVLKIVDHFLSRIREEQEAAAGLVNDGWNCYLYSVFEFQKASFDYGEFKPPFTTPPAAPECNCEELVEALEMYRGQYANDGKSGYAEDAIANHAKRQHSALGVGDSCDGPWPSYITGVKRHTDSVLRWEDGDLVLGSVAFATTLETIDGAEWAILDFKKWHKADNIEQARRAAEKALGLIDGLIIDVVGRVTGAGATGRPPSRRG